MAVVADETLTIRRQRASRRRDLIEAQWELNVLELAHANVVELEIDLVVNLLFGDQLMFRIHRDLDVVADADPSAGVHRPAVRVRQRDLVLAALLQRLAMSLEPRAPRLDRRDLLLEIGDLGAIEAIRVLLVLRVGFVEAFEI